MTESDSRPVWLLDVDGVINGTGKAGWGGPPRTARVHVEDVQYQLRWAPQLIVRIRKLLPLIEVRWATSWLDVGTEDLERVFGLPALPAAYAGDPSRLTAGRHLPELHAAAKTEAALDVAASGRRLIWTDDEAIPADGAARHTLDAYGALLLEPDPRRGLREEHLAQIDAYVTDS